MSCSFRPFFKATRKRWYVQIGKKQFNLGPDKDQAQERYHELMRCHQRETDTSLAIGVMDAFLVWAEQNTAPRTFEWYKRHLEVFQDFLRRLPAHPIAVGQLKKHHLTECLGKHPKWASATKNAFCRAVCRAFQWGEDQEMILKSPVRGFKKPKAKRREAVATEKEYQTAVTLFRRQELKELLTIAWETGARPQELFAVERRHIDLDTGRFVFPAEESKGKEFPRIAYLTASALEIIRRLCHRYPEGPLFRNEDGNRWTRHATSCAFLRIKKRIGRRLCLYSFRHVGDERSQTRRGPVDGSHPAWPCRSIHSVEGVPAPRP